MKDSVLTDTLRERLPRIFAAGADHNDVQTVISRTRSMEDWPLQWSLMAELHAGLGDAALANSQRLTAGEAFAREALYYHLGQFAYFTDGEKKRSLQKLQNLAYAKAAPLLSPPADLLMIEANGYKIAANLRIPENAICPPCVILNPGADSTKEEFQTLETVFHKRGLATCSFDGPGQGLTWANAKLQADFEIPIGYVLDALSDRTDINTQCLGLWGRSFGAYACLRGATDRRIKAVVSIGGFYDLNDVWLRMPFSTQQSIAYAIGAVDVDAARTLIKPYSLCGVLQKVECPVLIVHSGGDTVCPVEESQRMIDDLTAPVDFHLFEDGNHVCDNIAYKVRPLMADWLSAKLF